MYTTKYALHVTFNDSKPQKNIITRPIYVTIGLKFVKLSPLSYNGVKPGVTAVVFSLSKTINSTVLIRKRD